MSLWNKTAESLVLKTGKAVWLSARCQGSPSLSPSCLYSDGCLRLLIKMSAHPRQRCSPGDGCRGLCCTHCKAVAELGEHRQRCVAVQVPSVHPAVVSVPSWCQKCWFGQAGLPTSPCCSCTRTQNCTQCPFLSSLCSVLLLSGLAMIRQGGMGHKSQSNSYGMMLVFLFLFAIFLSVHQFYSRGLEQLCAWFLLKVADIC